MKCDKPKEKTTTMAFRQKKNEDCNVKDGDKCCPCTDQRNLQVALEIANSAHFTNTSVSAEKEAFASENFPSFLETHDEMHYQKQQNPNSHHGQCCPCAMK